MSIKRTGVIGRGIYIHPYYYNFLPDEVKDECITINAYTENSAYFYGNIIEKVDEGYARVFNNSFFTRLHKAEAMDEQIQSKAKQYGIKGNIEWFFGVMVD